MNISLKRPDALLKGKQQALVVGLPQVNLLPPEVHAARGMRTTKRLLAMSLAGVVGLCALGYVASTFRAASAQSELGDAQARTSALMVEKAKYAEVPRVQSALASAQTAQQLGMSTEVQWRQYIDAITAVLPEGVSIDSFSTNGATPMTAATPPSNPLQAVSVGQIQFTARSLTLPDTAAWMDALDSVPGLADSWVPSATVTASEDGNTVYYTVSATVQLLDSAYSHRFDVVEEGK